MTDKVTHYKAIPRTAFDKRAVKKGQLESKGTRKKFPLFDSASLLAQRNTKQWGQIIFEFAFRNTMFFGIILIQVFYKELHLLPIPNFRKHLPPFNSFRGNYLIYEVKKIAIIQKNIQTSTFFTFKKIVSAETKRENAANEINTNTL